MEKYLHSNYPESEDEWKEAKQPITRISNGKPISLGLNNHRLKSLSGINPYDDTLKKITENLDKQNPDWQISEMEKEIRISLFKGGCAKRYNCNNINKKCCNPIPKDEDNFVMCKYYKRKRRRNNEKRKTKN